MDSYEIKSCFSLLYKYSNVYIYFLLFHDISDKTLHKDKLLHRYASFNLLNILNRIIHLPFLKLSIVIFRKYQDENLEVKEYQQYKAW